VVLVASGSQGLTVYQLHPLRFLAGLEGHLEPLNFAYIWGCFDLKETFYSIRAANLHS